ncbi:MAG: hypothetical protein ACI934_001584, partial [Pseudohongiellaceae bacterium]
CGYRSNSAQLPEIIQRLGGMAFKIPVGSVYRLPDTIEIRFPGNSVEMFAWLGACICYKQGQNGADREEFNKFV